MPKFMKVVLILGFVFLILAGGLQAQPPASFPDGTVGVPYVFSFGIDLAQISSMVASIPDITFTLDFSVTGGAFPPGLTFSIEGVQGTPTAAGDFTFTVTEHLAITYMGMSIIDDTIPGGTFTIHVSAGAGPAVSVAPGALSFSATQGSTASLSQSLLISNRSSQTQTFTASAATASGGSWLSVAGGGTVAPFGSASAMVAVNPGNLQAGTFSGSITVTVSPAGLTTQIPVTLTVSGGKSLIQISQSGFRFQTVAGGGKPSPQTLNIFNSGAGSLPFTVTAAPVGGGTWLSATPASGSATSASPGAVSISVDPTGLAAGDYYGQVYIAASGVDNSPQVVEVVLNIAAAGTDLGAFVQPTALIFVASAGTTNPASKTVTVTNPNGKILNFTAIKFFTQGNNWFTALPANSPVPAGGSTTVTVQAVVSGLASGIYTGELRLSFDDMTDRRIAILLIVLPAGTTPNFVSGGTGDRFLSPVSRAASCNPTKLIPVFSQLGANFGVVAAWPVALEVTVVDDCGNPLTSGNVIATFSSGDPPLSMLSLRDGRFSATWQPRSVVPQVTITASAQESTPALSGTASIGGALAANPKVPTISAGGLVSAASLTLNQPVSPGSFVSIFGSNLSNGSNQSQSYPFPTQLGTTQAVLAGEPLPLYIAYNGQINAVLPYDIPVNTTVQLVVSNGPAISFPEPVVVASAQPAVFTQDQSGKGPGAIVDVKADGTQALVDANHPLVAGDVAVIYCSGLGAVNPAVPAGAAASLTVLSNTTNPVTVSIGGQSAQVLFAGLAPGFAGLYQVNAVVPPGITPGNSVALVLTEAGQSSVPVTVAVK
jgi:uncharacterized protein (TIGR03437 family)